MLKDRLAQLLTSLETGVAQRATLAINHLLWREPAAAARLQAHAGRHIEFRFSGVPSRWPVPAPWCVAITRAGLLEIDDAPQAEPATVRVALDMSDPLDRAGALLRGDRRSIEIAGDAALAADVAWLFEHLRWDIEDDLERFVGPAAAHGIARAGSGVAAVARSALGAFAALRGPRRPTAR